ncbi:MAG: ROK family transcriptional regulator [Lachnospiraceae bacterium]|jgi:predicted NBD/HSP70 family sugar kinase
MNTPVRTTMMLKQKNKELVISAFREMGQATRNDIAQLTGLSISTCGNIIRELVESGELTLGDMTPSQGGRPSKTYIFDANTSLALAISLVSNGNFNQVELATVNLQGAVLAKESYIQPLKQLTFDFLDTLIAKQFEATPKIKVIGIGIPGMVSHGEVLYCDMEELEHLNLRDLLQTKYHVSVFVDNEMHFKTFGYFQTHHDMNLKNYALLNVPEHYTYGAGFMVDGQLIRGNANFSGEINYLPYVSSRKDLIEQCSNDESFLQLITKVIITIITITDPRHIILCGLRFTDDLAMQIQENIKKVLPPQLLPNFHLQQDISDEYLTGIINVLNNLLTDETPYHC